MVCSRQSIGWGGLWRSCCPSCQIFGAVRFEPKRSFLDSPRERRCSCAVDFWHIVVKPRRRKTTRTHYRFWKSRWNNESVCDASGLGGFVRRYLSTKSLRITSNFFRCTMYLASHSVLCHCLVKQHATLRIRLSEWCQGTTKLTQARPGELIQWVTPESRSSAASNSGLISIGTQPRTADAWHHDSCRPCGVVTRDFSAIFDRLFDRLPVRISTSDLHHWILRKNIFHIRAYDFGVQFSFKTLKKKKTGVSFSTFEKYKKKKQQLRDLFVGTDFRVKSSHTGNWKSIELKSWWNLLSLAVFETGTPTQLESVWGHSGVFACVETSSVLKLWLCANGHKMFHLSAESQTSRKKLVQMTVDKKRHVKGEVRRKMNFIYVLGFVVLRDVVKVFPVSSPSFARKMTGRNRARSHSGAWRGLKTKWDLKFSRLSPTYLIRYLFIEVGATTPKLKLDAFQL